MMTEEREDRDGEPVAVIPADPLRRAFGRAILALGEELGDCEAFRFAAREIFEAETRTRLALRRRVLN